MSGAQIRLLEASAFMGYALAERSVSAEVNEQLRQSRFRIEDEALERGCTHFAGWRGGAVDSWLCRTRFPLDVEHDTSLNLIVLGEGKDDASGAVFEVRDASTGARLPRRDASRTDVPDTWLPVRQGFLLFLAARSLDSPPPPLHYRVSYPVDPDYLAQHDWLESEQEPVAFALRKVDLDGDIRPALFAPGPSRFIFRVVVPEAGRLSLGVGVLEAGWFESDGVEFSISVRSSAGAEQTLLSKRLAPRSNESHRSWRDLDIDLSAFARDAVELTFATEITAQGGPALGAFASPTVYSGRARRTPVILIDLDTLRADHLEPYGYPKPTSPVIEALARDGVVFENAIAQAPWTLPSQMSILTGLYPASHGVRDPEQSLAPDVATLASLLRGHGYFTKALTDGAFMSHRFGFDSGFDSYSEHRGQRAGSYALSADLMRRFRHWFDLWVPSSIFLLIHSFETHAPYAPGTEDLLRFDSGYTGDVGERFNRAFVRRDTDAFSASPRERAHLVARYDAGIRDVDRMLGQMFRLLEARGLYDEALIILLSDHGEEFQEHGGWQHGHTLHDELIRVPLIIKFPRGSIPAGRVARPVELIDVLPTVLDFLALPIPDGLDGRSLLPGLRDEEGADASAPVFAISEERLGVGIAVRSATHKLIRSHDSTRVYALAEDPGEQQPLRDVDPDLLAELNAVADAYLASEKARAGGASGESPEHGRSSIGEDLRTRLRALGYLE